MRAPESFHRRSAMLKVRDHENAPLSVTLAWCIPDGSPAG